MLLEVRKFPYPDLSAQFITLLVVNDGWIAEEIVAWIGEMFLNMCPVGSWDDKFHFQAR